MTIVVVVILCSIGVGVGLVGLLTAVWGPATPALATGPRRATRLRTM